MAASSSQSSADKIATQNDSAVNGGSGTARKVVQWLDDHVNSQSQRHHDHTLDETGKDPNAFKSLTSALERHQSQQRSSTSGDTEAKRRPSLTNTPSPITPPSSVPIPLIHHNDPLPRVEVPGQFIEPHERAGLPSFTNLEADAERQAAGIVRAHTSRRKSWLGLRSRTKSKVKDGDKDTVLRGVGRNDVTSYDYVAVPTGVSDIDCLTAGVDPPRQSDLERDADTVSVQTTVSTSDIVPPNSGILSALLALYNSQHRDQAYDRLSSNASGASTPEMPERPCVDLSHLPRDGGGRYNGYGRERTWRSRSQSLEGNENEKGEAIDEFDDVFRKAHENAQINVKPQPVSSNPSCTPLRPSVSPHPRPLSVPPSHHFTQYSEPPPKDPQPQPFNHPHHSLCPSLTSLNPFSSRPAQARNAAGVIGPLIASTANLSGAAAPVNSRIVPNVKRPGYHLSRYSWDDRSPTIKVKKKKDNQLKRNGYKSLDNADLPQTGLRTGDGKYESSASDRARLLRKRPMTEPVSAYVSPPMPDQHDRSATSRRGRDSTSGYFSSAQGKRAKWTGVLDLRREDTSDSVGKGNHSIGWGWGRLTPGRATPVGGKSGQSTPTTQYSPPLTPSAFTLTPLSDLGEWISDAWLDRGRAEKAPEWRERKERKERDRRERGRKEKRKRKKAEIYITRHVAQILQRQEFLLKLTRSMMMFGAPAHRLPSQIAATARVLEIPLSCLYLPDVMIISFDDMLGSLGAATSNVGSGTLAENGNSSSSSVPALTASTSSLRLLRQSSALDLGKLKGAYDIYWKVIHDEVSVAEASGGLDSLMRRPVLYGRFASMFIGGMCSASICSVSFNGSFVDCLVVFPLGVSLVFIQSLAAKNELYSNVFEITITTLFSFISAALASTSKICYSAVASSSIVLILPGFIVLSGALEVLSRNIVSGSVRMCYAVVYCLFLGFGLAMGAEAYQKMTSRSVVGLADTACAYSHGDNAQWWNSNVSTWWAFLTVPLFSLFLTMRNQGPLFRREMLITIIIACIGWVTNHFVATVFVGQADISAAVGAFAVGFIANMYGRFFSGNAFVIMITGILFQVPSGLGNNGLLVFVDQQSSGSSESYLSGFQTALQLISVALGLTVGLGISLFLAYPIQSRRRAGGVFSL
ncbi:hypothetical protein E1B28_008954 [Marasmius oreades]|uniref:DUF1212-domain-containing protein n=1 Tax=Marasmius oreades TaxID=181124 RepID=A0A9P7UTT6_9AGAR|nr:uncharacterized protein E1B28_008954 [Marasmius oreades]KAG7092611.1 hypothetical protein E1B28_008954 [Marasmius oreades]